MYNDDSIFETISVQMSKVYSTVYCRNVVPATTRGFISTNLVPRYKHTRSKNQLFSNDTDTSVPRVSNQKSNRSSRTIIKSCQSIIFRPRRLTSVSPSRKIEQPPKAKEDSTTPTQSPQIITITLVARGGSQHPSTLPPLPPCSNPRGHPYDFS